MRLWSLHPSLLDRQGLTACWREALLAQAVLRGTTRGYTAHPQLERFRATDDPVAAISSYLHGVRAEAERRGYRFDGERIARPADPRTHLIPVTQGQVDLEWQHLLRKLVQRSPADHARVSAGGPSPHPLFFVVPGAAASWERAR
ncbi:pyrimidine dimer DNA glycosylase/endonuclease V [Microbacterium sp. NPDC096154]|uniref:pyrimidine dimer DNA glycosylase/endonuclease V n=1 Tax=Microbacterium sp. NPDC096154 TaxID=3155549 RepID=UPI00331AC3B7